MSKAVTKGAHWLPRTSQYSLHGKRNGHVEVLPANAKPATFDDLRERYAHQKALVQDLRAAYIAQQKHVREAPEFARYRHLIREPSDPKFASQMPTIMARCLDRLDTLRQQLTAADARLADYKQAFFAERDTRYERAWITTAKLMLPHDVVDRIERQVSAAYRDSRLPDNEGDSRDGG